MGKELSEMTLEELWELFPIFLVEPNEKWNDRYKELEELLQQVLADCQVDRISHIGSTAISGIWAKNIVDILIEVNPSDVIEKAADILSRDGFIIMNAGTECISLNKGYTKNGFAEKVYHIHIRYTGDNDELYFRDYLNEFSDVAKEYETLKLTLWKKYVHNRDAYTEAKTDFIQKKTQEAKMRYGNRYKSKT